MGNIYLIDVSLSPPPPLSLKTNLSSGEDLKKRKKKSLERRNRQVGHASLNYIVKVKKPGLWTSQEGKTM